MRFEVRTDVPGDETYAAVATRGDGVLGWYVTRADAESAVALAEKNAPAGWMGYPNPFAQVTASGSRSDAGKFHLPGQHPQKRHGRLGPQELDENGIPVGFDVSGLTEGGWSPDDPRVVGLAQIAASHGFKKLTHLPELASVHGWVDPREEATLVIGSAEHWFGDGADEKLAKFLETGWVMGVAERIPWPDYLMSHEAGHLVGREKGGTTRQKKVLKRVVGEWAEANGVKMADGQPLDLTQQAGRDVLREWGLSEYGATSFDEMYAELYAAWYNGDDMSLAVAVAEAEGWER